MPPPLAYYLTWTTYGTWLHGDPRGSIDREHRGRNTPVVAPDNARQERAAQRMTAPPFRLSRDDRRVVTSAIRERCHARGWTIRALEVRTNHIHLVVASHTSPERTMAACKAIATQRLREANLADPNSRLWTHHGSTRWINSQASLLNAMQYVGELQDCRPRRPPLRYEPRTK